MKCKHCNSLSIVKNGVRDGKQRFRCCECKKHFISKYHYLGAEPESTNKVVKCIKNGMGIRNISRVLGISTTTVISKIRRIGASIKKPTDFEHNSKFEMDELHTYIKSKQNRIWLIYAIDRKTKSVVDFIIGRRTSNNASQIVNKLLTLSPKTIHTDKLYLYPSLIPNNIHQSKVYGTNIIERNNLSLRTNLKRLQRKTFSFSKSQEFLENCLKIFFWA